MEKAIKAKNIIDGKSKNRNLNPIIIAVCVILVLYSLTMFIILGWGFLTSLKSSIDFISKRNVLGWPDAELSAAELQFNNYKIVFTIFEYKTNGVNYNSAIWGKISRAGEFVGFGDFVVNSFVYALVGSFVQSFVCMTAAFMCCKYRYKFSYFIYTMLLVIMTIPIVGNQPSTIQVLYDLGIYDTYFAMFIMSANMCGMYYFVYFAFFHTISDTYMEAAEIDGSSQLMTYLRIVIPLSAKMLGTIMLINFITLWNNYTVPMMYYPTKPTLAQAIYAMSNNTLHVPNQFYNQNIPQRVAGCMVLAIPMIILFIALKNVILGNLSMGGLKE